MTVKQWLYKGGRPNWLASLLNRGWAIIHGLGIAPDYLVTLEVTGRRSGRTISLPLVMARLNGERYLVSMLGTEAGWVRNVQAADGKAVLRHGRHENVRLVEVPVEQRAPILKAYLQKAPGARGHVSVDKDAPLSEFERVAAKYPVFRVLTGRSHADEP
ncbi:MAG TPA: nitroreductase/quinone reductase family protein [Anaerolineae bacterium]|nr:nitroreductase/quinone reductase family protein [Anaerolineae bacterium]